MKKVIFFCGYRDWALKIYDYIKGKYDDKADFLLIKSEEEFNGKILSSKPDLILFVGWSWIIGKEVVNKFKCICMHPSPLPKYRGGSPLQHQIINGEEKSAVTLFLMDEHVDKGPILWQENFSLDGDLGIILLKIVERGREGVGTVIDNFLNDGKLEGMAQDENEATYFKRRKPEESEIKISDFGNKTAKDIHNKIRALQDPYPNAFVVCKDGTKLFLKKSEFEE
jgi:methionyl-tRNA formyltransferase